MLLMMLCNLQPPSWALISVYSFCGPLLHNLTLLPKTATVTAPWLWIFQLCQLLNLPYRSSFSPCWRMSFIIMRQKLTEHCPLNTSTILSKWATEPQDLVTHCNCPLTLNLQTLPNIQSSLLTFFSTMLPHVPHHYKLKFDWKLFT